METSLQATIPPNVLLKQYLYSDMKEKIKHFGEIQSIAGKLHLTITEIAPLYEDVLESLRCNAKVTDYLPILVSKKVCELCKKKH
jgi:hypothetical protein